MYLPEANSQSEVEYGEIKRPRLEMGAEPLMRHPPHRPPLAGAEDVVKVSDLKMKVSEITGSETTGSLNARFA